MMPRRLKNWETFLAKISPSWQSRELTNWNIFSLCSTKLKFYCYCLMLHSSHRYLVLLFCCFGICRYLYFVNFWSLINFENMYIFNEIVGTYRPQNLRRQPLRISTPFFLILSWLLYYNLVLSIWLLRLCRLWKIKPRLSKNSGPLCFSWSWNEEKKMPICQ